MRALDRNKQPVYYRLYAGKTAAVDANGNRTGEYTLNYGNVAKVYGNVSAARGSADVAQFGIDLAYSRTLVLGDTATPISEDTPIWVGYGEVAAYGTGVSYSAGDVTVKDGKLQRYNGSTWDEEPYNYRVARVAKSINFTMIALREVDCR